MSTDEVWRAEVPVELRVRSNPRTRDCLARAMSRRPHAQRHADGPQAFTFRERLEMKRVVGSINGEPAIRSASSRCLQPAPRAQSRRVWAAASDRQSRAPKRKILHLRA